MEFQKGLKPRLMQPLSVTSRDEKCRVTKKGVYIMKAIIGFWKDDPCKNMQMYEFKSWSEALCFCKQQINNF